MLGRARMGSRQRKWFYFKLIMFTAAQAELGRCLNDFFFIIKGRLRHDHPSLSCFKGNALLFGGLCLHLNVVDGVFASI